MPPSPGFFIEAGANDGYNQSNTYYLERFLGWRGLLVEPIPELAAACAAERPRSRVVQAALVASTFTAREIALHAASLMSKVSSTFPSEAERDAIMARAIAAQDLAGYSEIMVPARTLTSILDEDPPPRIDFLSLDVEGYEEQVLDGLDFSRYRPRFILIEHPDGDEPLPWLTSRGYVWRTRIVPHDVLYEWMPGAR